MAEDVRARLVRTAGIRALEAAARQGRPEVSLMERAGAAIARTALAMAAERPGPIVVLAGPGNNGGDALVAARLLQERGALVRVALLDPARAASGDAAQARARWDALGVAPSDPLPVLASASLVVDGLFGVGFDRAPTGLAREWIARTAEARCPVLAIDVPSGLDADTGHVADVAVVATRTVTFLANKPGLVTGDGVDHAGDVVVDALGIDRDESFGRVALERGIAGSINDPSSFPTVGLPRARNSHKGTFGSVAVIGGDHGMVGAALMTARTALHGGAGRVYVRLIAADAPGHDFVQPELMLRDSLDGVDPGTVAIGPGLGHGEKALALLEEWLANARSLCVDADALNAIAANAALATRLRGRTTPAVLTPHPLEAARLLGSDAKAVQRDRIAAATTLARDFASVVVLKGAGTVIATPDGAWTINTTGNPALATGGTGDVLCGLVAALLAQGVPPEEAARGATWLHGSAADSLVASGTGPIGMVATELIPAIRAALNALDR
jgi:hydroxyethylthiazole kinase-like uncharacterized protein yjeF